MNCLPEKCHKEMDQVYLGKLGKGDLKNPEKLSKYIKLQVKLSKLNFLILYWSTYI